MKEWYTERGKYEFLKPAYLKMYDMKIKSSKEF